MFHDNRSSTDVSSASFNDRNATWRPDALSWSSVDDVIKENSSAGVECTNEYCVSDEDYRQMIHDYVFPTSFEWALTTLYVIVFLIGLTGNALVVYVVWRNANMRTVTNLFIVNLSVADLLVIIICLPPTALVDITETWFFGLTMCKIVHYVQGVSVSVSVMTLTFLSIERYFAIVHPLRFRATMFRTRVTILIIWIVSCTLLIPELVVLDVVNRWPHEFSQLLTSCRPDWTPERQTAYQVVLLVTLYALPLTVMAFAYIQIARRLWTSLATTMIVPESPDSPAFEGVNSSLASSLKRSEPRFLMRTSRCSSYDVSSRLRARRNVAKMLIVVVIIFAVCYLPVHLLNICRYARVRIGDDVATYLALIAHWLCYFNSAINPVIYNLMSARFLKSFKRACCCATCDGCGDGCYGDSCLRCYSRCRRHCCRRGHRHSTLSAMFPASCRTNTAAVSSSSHHSEPIQLGVVAMAANVNCHNNAAGDGVNQAVDRL